jgi:hypothetical protein
VLAALRASPINPKEKKKKKRQKKRKKKAFFLGAGHGLSRFFGKKYYLSDDVEFIGIW